MKNRRKKKRCEWMEVNSLPSDMELGILVPGGRQAGVFQPPPHMSERFTRHCLGHTHTHTPTRINTLLQEGPDKARPPLSPTEGQAGWRRGGGGDGRTRHLMGSQGKETRPGLPRAACGSGERRWNTAAQGVPRPPSSDAGHESAATPRPRPPGRALLIIGEAGLHVNVSRKRWCDATTRSLHAEGGGVSGERRLHPAGSRRPPAFRTRGPT